MGKAKRCFMIMLVVLLLLAILFGGFKYRTSYAKTELVTETSSDGQYTLKIYMIGEPDWPFGATHCRFDLLEGAKRIVKVPFSIYDDGAMARKGNFDIRWNEDNVTILVSGSEQDQDAYVLKFDGTVAEAKNFNF